MRYIQRALLLDRKISEHLQSSGDSIKNTYHTHTQTVKRQKQRKTKQNKTIPQKKQMPENIIGRMQRRAGKHQEGHSIKKRQFGIPPAASHPVPSQDRNYLTLASIIDSIASTTPGYSQGFRLLIRSNLRQNDTEPCISDCSDRRVYEGKIMFYIYIYSISIVFAREGSVADSHY